MARTRKDVRDERETRVRLLAPYRFHDDDGHAHHWHAGETVTGSDAALLIARQAPIEVI